MTAKIINNFISLEEIEQVNDYYSNIPFASEGVHTDFPNKIQWQNSPIADWIWSDILDKKIRKEFGDYEISHGCGVFQRCSMPFGMHIDSKQRITNENPQFADTWKTEGFALAIPLNEDPHFCTVFFDEYFNTDKEKFDSMKNFSELSDDEVINSGISKIYDLDFCWDDPRRKLQDHYKFDIAFPWKLGQAATWGRTQLHVSTDFAKHGLYKDCLTIFFE